ncbi:tRNA pseudouridine synthase A [Magnetospirillum sp. LM-5]|uniref:tRNA pseudouridine(38-40) synthase TruA n=1 Tax=Magnetospirillum sp. LM-5 TaxID=2681466 RepID=UPI0013851E63|nr:tRNA pseudouridine(38-40) synthase TruA [Magnetospirillum sp. LM-5]CAA7616593.1 tRNA pseudouridine synthase A [Magnetospirillum sp. LM-5]
MPRYRLLVEYDGTPFVGWQRQPLGDSVQGVLEQALAKLCGQPVMVQCAGRTDAGVHASGQVAHVDLPREYSADAVRDAANFHAKPHPVAVLRAELVPDDFHARFSAVGRAYVYRILNRRAPSVLDKNRVWWVPVGLDVQRMQDGANHLLGCHDFTSFRAAACQAASPVKHLDVLDVRRCGEMIEIHAAARSFLHHQVRNMVGTLKLVGEGKWSPDDVRIALEARARAAAGPTAPPEGLYLTTVRY